jgi:hypothetical protein
LHDIPHTHTHTRGASKEQGGSKIPLVLFVGCQLSRGGKVGWLVSGKKEEAELPLTAVSCCCVATAACSTALFPLSLSLCPSVYQGLFSLVFFLMAYGVLDGMHLRTLGVGNGEVFMFQRAA